MVTLRVNDTEGGLPVLTAASNPPVCGTKKRPMAVKVSEIYIISVVTALESGRCLL